MGLLSKVVDRIKSVAADDDLVVEDGRVDHHDDGTIRIVEAVDRHRATVQGRVRALTLPTTTAVTALVVEVADATGAIQLVFVGRKAIPGIECGVTLRAHGRVSIRRGHRIMYNPAYEIVPHRES
ncbi:DNA-binding protein [Nostocoides sp. F2B08]|uniref:OB-fold nucleic acid binding domain-containing protein n=1 Tax=Nostocoides sp. F2B08 TaxID=2653936 RepID=UPI0012639CCF|nr:OB-fold nucleic acid binding domain-containing protein [Tetrasphaera sp. F2B08]KAB7742417.1 DNA-binding protein [Tetrasphaera sp. F2B08]